MARTLDFLLVRGGKSADINFIVTQTLESFDETGILSFSLWGNPTKTVADVCRDAGIKNGRIRCVSMNTLLADGRDVRHTPEWGGPDHYDVMLDEGALRGSVEQVVGLLLPDEPNPARM